MNSPRSTTSSPSVASDDLQTNSGAQSEDAMHSLGGSVALAVPDGDHAASMNEADVQKEEDEESPFRV